MHDTDHDQKLLLSCMHCGSAHVSLNDTLKTSFYYCCDGCGAATGFYASAFEARQAWNRRVGIAAPSAFTVQRVVVALRMLIDHPNDAEGRNLAAINEGNAALAALASEQVSLAYRNRDAGGWLVREAWILWARTQSNPQSSWLVPYEDLSEQDKEADRQIYEACYREIRGVGSEPLAWYNPETEAVIGWKAYEAGQRAGGASLSAISGYTEPLHAPHRTGLPPDLLASVAADGKPSAAAAVVHTATRYAYSHDEEHYHGDFDSVAHAIEAAFDDGAIEVCWVGEIGTIDPADYFDADTLLDRAASAANEELGECADEYLSDLSEEAKAELEGLLSGWARKHARPAFWRAVNCERYDRSELALDAS